MHDPLYLTFVLLFGLAFGSFFNVVIYRLPNGMSLLRPPSHCPKCDNLIKSYDNIPILSFLILRGKCRHCKASISWRYPAVEALTGVLAVVAIYHFGFTIKGIEAALLSLLFVPIFFIDMEHWIIPDSLDLPWILVGLALAFVSGGFVGWKGALIGAVVGGGLFFLIMQLGKVAFKKEAMGFGDVKFAAMLGAFLGGWKLLLIILLASFLGSVVGVTLIISSNKKGKPTYVPFGPFLVIAALISIYFGDSIIGAYLNLIRP
ncbi:MAG TPA: prepilin peptidase [candidate division Zixibacteria bacterium]|nr:prepilin peptidase [candidate division Zixibacteria bacterium]